MLNPNIQIYSEELAKQLEEKHIRFQQKPVVACETQPLIVPQIQKSMPPQMLHKVDPQIHFDTSNISMTTASTKQEVFEQIAKKPQQLYSKPQNELDNINFEEDEQDFIGGPGFGGSVQQDPFYFTGEQNQ